MRDNTVEIVQKYCPKGSIQSVLLFVTDFWRRLLCQKVIASSRMLWFWTKFILQRATRPNFHVIFLYLINNFLVDLTN